MKTLGCAILLSLSLVVPGTLAQEAQTLEERLSDKASDNQRVDNCRVPSEGRGPVPRPGCSTKFQHILLDGGSDRSTSQKAP